ncbi:MAG TPA: MBL fold metallo-hydrolase [Bacteroidales bacterium]|jgi:phosphoribosyl 1,2-cyclic phosphodiesterase|nr:MBL fold metallo-hydrolase [Bacteroidales bacterium]
MSLTFASLNSGSNGNCYYVGNEQDAVLIDAGISCRETFRRMSRLGLDFMKVRAVFISHEHSDHTRGAEVLSRKMNLPVYITAATHSHSNIRISPSLLNYFSPDDKISLGSLVVEPFAKRHDAADPQSFVISHNGLNVGVMTDIGSACEEVKAQFGRCHAAFLEANYDEQMLEQSFYPYYLKKRIRSDHGHLSNDQALDLFSNHRSSGLKHLVLSHLSKVNNKPEIVRELFGRHANGTVISIASRYEESEVFSVD